MGWLDRGAGSLAVVAATLGAGGAAAQEASVGGALNPTGIGSTQPSGAISTGRPSFSTGPGTVPRGSLQLEGGYVLNQDDGDSTQSAPLLVLRAGVAEDTELRVGWSGLVATETDGDTDTDAGDVFLGVKRTLYEPGDGSTTVGVLGQVSFPTGGGDATSDSVDPSLGLLWSYDVPGPATTFGTVIVSSLTNDDDGRFSQLGASFGAGFPIASNLNGYVEYFGVFADEGAPSNNLNGGLLYLVSDNVQLDLFARVGLNDSAGDFGLGAGFGVRF